MKKIVIFFIIALLCFNNITACTPISKDVEISPTRTKKASTSTQTQVQTVMGNKWDWQDKKDDSIQSIFDILSGEGTLSGNNLEICMRLREVPQEIVLSRSSLSENALDYAWLVEIDLDGDSLKDLQFGLFHFKLSGEEETKVSLKEPITWGQTNYWIYSENDKSKSTYEAGYIEVYFDIDDNAIHFKADHPKFHPDMNIKLLTMASIPMDKTEMTSSYPAEIEIGSPTITATKGYTSTNAPTETQKFTSGIECLKLYEMPEYGKVFTTQGIKNVTVKNDGTIEIITKKANIEIVQKSINQMDLTWTDGEHTKRYNIEIADSDTGQIISFAVKTLEKKALVCCFMK